MSYILDALRRAESERDRERGVPGLNAQPVPVGSLLGGPTRRNRAALWVVIGLALGLAVPLGWRWMAADDSATSDTRMAASGSVTPAAPMAAQAPPAPSTAVAVAQAPPPVPPEGGRVMRPPVDLPAPVTGVNPGDQVAPPQPAARPRGQAAAAAVTGQPATPPARPTAGPAHRTGGAAPASPRAGSATARAEPAAPPSARAGGQAQPPSAMIAAPLQRLSDLPEDLRRQVPTLSFGGSVYSALSAQRMVIFNGQVLREGDLVADGLTVEEIRAKSAVLRLRGQRFEVVF